MGQPDEGFANAWPLVGRGHECGALDQLVGAARTGRGGVLVLHGEAGIGKTALLDHVAAAASDLRLVRAAGVEAERELAFATLHQLCVPMLDRLKDLPAPQREALKVAFGLAAGPDPDRFLVGVAVLGLLSGGAGAPLVCLIDDAQWLDPSSAQALIFAARRLEAEAVLLVFATRELSPAFRGLPDLRVEGLPEREAGQLLASLVHWPMDERVRDQIIAEARGNPLALMQLPCGRSPARLAGDYVAPPPPAPLSQVEERFRGQLVDLPAATRKLLLVAAADPVGDPAVVWRAARHLGVPASAATAAAEAGLLEFDTRARFLHPLARSAAYRIARLDDRQEAHLALAQAIDPEVDPDRCAWHRAQATPGPDDEVAGELVRSAGRAQTRGGLAAAAAFLERAATLTSEPALRAQRALDAAETTVRAGVFGPAAELLTLAQTGPLNGSQEAGVDLVRARFAYAARHNAEAVAALLSAAKQLEPIDAGGARLTYLDAFGAARLTGRLAGAAATIREVARAAANAPAPPHRPRACDLLLDGLAAYPASEQTAIPLLRQAITRMGGRDPDLSVEEDLRCQWPAGLAAFHLWDDSEWDRLTGRHVHLARQTGTLSELPLALTSRIWLELLAGRLTAAAEFTEQLAAVTNAVGGGLAPPAAICVAAFQGREKETRELAGRIHRDAHRHGEGIGITAAEWAKAVLGNGHGRYDDACLAAGAAITEAEIEAAEPGPASWALAELVEAAARAGAAAQATNALRRLSRLAGFLGTPWASGVEARSRALMLEGNRAEPLYREAIEHLAQTRMRTELARAHLLYGEWLRRESRRVDARDQLHTAFEMLSTMGLDAFADRAWRELVATGETVRKRGVDAPKDLTAQEAQIALLARDGLSNPEISLQLFISARTVEWHLRKVFTKLGITSRRQLRHALPEAVRAANGSPHQGTSRR